MQFCMVNILTDGQADKPIWTPLLMFIQNVYIVHGVEDAWLKLIYTLQGYKKI